MVALERRLEWVGGWSSDRAALLVAVSSAHQVIVLIWIVLLATPDSPCNKEHSTENSSSTDTNNNANDSLLRTRTHARAFSTAAAVRESGSSGRLCGCHNCAARGQDTRVSATTADSNDSGNILLDLGGWSSRSLFLGGCLGV